MADFRGLWFKGDDDKEWQLVQLHAVDAANALEVDPVHWKTEKPSSKPANRAAADKLSAPVFISEEDDQ